MKLYYNPGDVSLAARMILHEGGIVLDGDKLACARVAGSSPVDDPGRTYAEAAVPEKTRISLRDSPVIV